MKMVSNFYFIGKVLRKTLAALSTNASFSKITRHLTTNRETMLLKRCFYEMQSYAENEKKVKSFQIMSIITKIKQTIRSWREYSFTMKREREIVKYFKERRNQHVKLEFFASLCHFTQNDLRVSRTFKL